MMKHIVKTFKGSWDAENNEVISLEFKTSGNPLPHPSPNTIGHTYHIFKSGYYAGRDWKAGCYIMSTGEEWTNLLEFIDEDGNQFKFVNEEIFSPLDVDRNISDELFEKIELKMVTGSPKVYIPYVRVIHPDVRVIQPYVPYVPDVQPDEVCLDIPKSNMKHDKSDPRKLWITTTTNLGGSQHFDVETDVESPTNKPIAELSHHRKGLISFEDHQASALTKYEERKKVIFNTNGIACPKCGSELYDPEPDIIITTLPAQVGTKCTNNKCDYNGFRFR